MSDHLYVVREARKSDCNEIRKLIQGLADYQKMSNGPKIDADRLKKDGFETNPPLFGCFVAEDTGSKEGLKLVGYALYFYTYSTWLGKKLFLEDIYVSEEVRGKRVGHRLFREVAKKAIAESCAFVEFAVLAGNPSQSFYEARGCVNLTLSESWHMYRLKGDALQKTAEN